MAKHRWLLAVAVLAALAAVMVPPPAGSDEASAVGVERSVPTPTTTTVGVAPTTTSTAAPPSAGRAVVPAGTWDAALAGTRAGARTAELDVDGIHVGPDQDHASIAAAVAAAPAGATLVIHDNGDAYREAMTPDAGWLAKPLRFVAAAGERPVVSGADLVATWQADGGRWFHQYEADRFEFPLPLGDDILPHQLTDTAPDAGLLEQVVVDGVPLRQRATLDGLASGEFHVDRAADRIYVADDPTGRVVEVSARSRALMLAAGAAGSSLEGITISGFAPRHLDGTAAVVIDGAADVVLRDVIVTRSSATGVLAVDADGLVLDHVSLIANGGRGMSGDRLRGLRVERTAVEANNAAAFDFDGCDDGASCVLAGIKLTRAHDVLVTFSSFRDNRATGFWCDLECTGLVFVGNRVVDNAGHGAYYEVSQEAVIEANVLAHNRRAGLKVSGSQDVDIAHNTFVANGAHLNVGADHRPATIGFHGSEATHMGDIDVVDNVFAETTERVVVVDPVNQDAAPNPWRRVGAFGDNLYVLVGTDTGSAWRFRQADGAFTIDPHRVVAPAALAVGDPAAHFVDLAGGDLRLAGPLAGLTGRPLSAAAAAWFPPLTVVPVGAPLF